MCPRSQLPVLQSSLPAALALAAGDAKADRLAIQTASNLVQLRLFHGEHEHRIAELACRAFTAQQRQEAEGRDLLEVLPTEVNREQDRDVGQRCRYTKERPHERLEKPSRDYGHRGCGAAMGRRRTNALDWLATSGAGR